MADVDIPQIRPIVTRVEAKRLGLLYFFNGKTCLHGHLAQRYVRDCACIDCTKLRRVKNKEKRRISAKKWEARNKQLVLNKHRRYRQKIKTSFSHLERKRQLQREWHHKNKVRLKEKRKASTRYYYERNRGKCLERTQKQRAANLAKYATYKRNRDARLKSAGGVHTELDILEIKKLQRNRCAYCRVLLDDYHVDHITPIKRGGTNDRKNLQLLCVGCNVHKSARDPIEFSQSRGLLV